MGRGGQWPWSIQPPLGGGLWTRQATFTCARLVGNDRIQKFTRRRPVPGELWRVRGGRRPIASAIQRGSGPGSYIYIADWGNERVQVLGPDGSFQLNLRGQATLSKWAADFLNVNPDEKRTREMSNLIPELPPHITTPYHISSQTEPISGDQVSVKLDREGRLYGH